MAFATYWITEAVITTDGPFNLFFKIRHLRYAKPFECFTCLSVWVGLLLALVATSDIKTWLMYGLGAAGAAVFLNYITE